jgi:hypothetical protein
MLRQYVGNRKGGTFSSTGGQWKKLNLQHFEKMIEKWVRLLNIQKLQRSIVCSGRRVQCRMRGVWSGAGKEAAGSEEMPIYNIF